MSFLFRIISKPAKAYYLAGKMTSGSIFFGNLLATIFKMDNDSGYNHRRNLFDNHTFKYFGYLLMKTIPWSIVWPKFWLETYHNPQNLLLSRANIIDSDNKIREEKIKYFGSEENFKIYVDRISKK